MRYASKETEHKLAKMFQLIPPDGFTQFWEMSTIEENPERIPVLVAGCRDASLSDEERYALMLVVLKSMAHMCRTHDGPPPPCWDEAVKILRDNKAEYQEMIDLWSGLDTPDPEDRSYLSPHMIRAFPPQAS